MRKTKISMALVFLLLGLSQVKGRAQSDTSTADSLLVRSLFNEVLAHGEAHENLRVLCKDIGHRLSGSPSAGRAMDWGKSVIESYGVDTAYIMPVEVPSWTR